MMKFAGVTMMLFINPLEILEIRPEEVDSFDEDFLKKKKKILFAEIELSDEGYLDYKNHKLTKSECEKAIDGLKKVSTKKIYKHLLNDQKLNDFLVNGSEDFFNSFNKESYSWLKEKTFIDFISPYFTPHFNSYLTKAFQKNNYHLLSSIIETKIFINSENTDKAFQGLRNELLSRIEGIKEIRESLKEEELQTIEFSLLPERVKNDFVIEIINILPLELQSQINSAGDEVNLLAKSIWEKSNFSDIPLKLLEYILTFNIESANLPTFKKNYDFFKQQYENQIEQEKNAPVLQKWSSIVLSLKETIEKVKDKKIKPKEINKKKLISFDINELNNLPSFADEIREQIALLIRSLSIDSYNTGQDIEVALSLIHKA